MKAGSTEKTAVIDLARMSGDTTVLSLIGNTPLIKLRRIFADTPHQVYAKLEFLNPSGSIKDRMSLYIIEDAERRGLIKPGDTIIDNSSGNTAVSVAMIGAVKGYRTVFTVPDKTSQEKIDLIKSLGAEVIICPHDVPHDHPESYYSAARRLAKELGAFLIDQYHNPKNIEAHYLTTAPEIWAQTGGAFDVFVAGIGTGGSFSGVARYLKEKNPEIRRIAVDPEGSIFYDYLKSGTTTEPQSYKVEGIGTDVLTRAMDYSVVDDVVRVGDRDAFLAAREVVRQEGMLVGGSSGSVIAAIQRMAAEYPEPTTFVTLFPDSGMRYLSKFLNDSWMTEHGFMP
jgi:cystathionine beta-synthase